MRCVCSYCTDTDKLSFTIFQLRFLSLWVGVVVNQANRSVEMAQNLGLMLGAQVSRGGRNSITARD